MSLILDGTTGLSDVDGTAAAPAIRGTDANTGVFFGTDVVGLSTGGSERVRVDTSGNVGIGTTTLNGKLNVLTATDSKLILNDGSTTGNVRLEAVNNAYSAYKPLETNGSVQIFATGATERARIDSSGNLLVGTTSLPASGPAAAASLVAGQYITSSKNVLVCKTTSASGFEALALVRNGNNGTVATFWQTDSGSAVGNISVTGSATAYNTSSDYRLKNTIAPMTGALAKVALLKPCTYKWNVDGSDGQGFIAHELAEVEPGCVTGEKDAVDADGNPQYQGIDTSFLVATLTAAIQEQQALINALNERLTALEGAAA